MAGLGTGPGLPGGVVKPVVVPPVVVPPVVSGLPVAATRCLGFGVDCTAAFSGCLAAGLVLLKTERNYS